MPTFDPPATRYVEPVHVVGIAATPLLPEHDAMLDELVFDVVHRALRDCGLRKPDIGLSVLASMDALDGRSISSGLSTTASGGYLNDAYRVEGDSGLAIAVAAHAVAAGDVDIAVAVGVHNPETRSSDAAGLRDFGEQISNLAFEPHMDRPVGLTAETVYALHSSYAVASGVADIDSLAATAAEEIQRGIGRPRAARRESVSPREVLDSRRVTWPLHELMLPAHTTGAVAVVLASPARAGRTLGRSARLIGLGHATGQYTWTGQWLTDPGAPTRRAAAAAYRQAGLASPADQVGIVEMSAPTPALLMPYLSALGVEKTACSINPSGGVRSSFPGLANGALRLLEAVEALEDSGSDVAVAHSVDTVTGTVSEDVTVFVLEAV